jgi:uncharacterized SAM-binding protein YcdF (DUF218 family)
MDSFNDFLRMLELGPLKGVATALILPPVPFIALIVLGAWWLRRRRYSLGWCTSLVGIVALWMSCTTTLSWALTQWLLRPPPALTAAVLDDLRLVAVEKKTAIVVLGGGRENYAPEFGMSNLNGWSMERLRYGVWLARATGLPLCFSGGVGYAAVEGVTEAETAERIAAQEFNLPLKWVEGRSRDTSENGQYTVNLLRQKGIERIVLVTHGFHMRRALGAFERAIARQGVAISLVPAPTGLAEHSGGWMPSNEGFVEVRMALREWFGRLAGA